MEDFEVSNIILDEIKTASPDNLEKLVNVLYSKHNIPRNQIMKVLTKLVEDEQIPLQFPLPGPRQFSQFIFSLDATWFWLEVLLCSVSVVSIYFINDNSSPLIYIRNIMGFVFSLFLPGYGFIKAVLPYKEFSPLERTLLSLGSSIAMVPFVGLLLNYLNNLTVAPILLSLFTLTLILSIIGIWREFRQK